MFFTYFYIRILMMKKISRSVSKFIALRAAFSQVTKAKNQAPSRR